MQTNLSEPSKFPKKKAILSWGFLILNILLWPTLVIWYSQSHPASKEDVPSNLEHMVLMSVLGVMGLVAGTLAYFVVLMTNCLTFDFKRPVWEDVKKRIYLANIIVPLIFMLGVGFLVSAFTKPMLMRMGVSEQVSYFAPIMGTLCVLQVSMIWVLVWAPLEKRLIKERVKGLGVSAEQMQGGLFVGLSDPNITSHKKRMFSIEEDIGMLWISPGQLIYWGDREQFGITRDQLVGVERKADTKSTTMLSGVTHVILHVKAFDGSVRQIRLHTEGIFTMGGKRKAMDELSARIDEWRSAVIMPPPVPPPMGQLL